MLLRKWIFGQRATKTFFEEGGLVYKKYQKPSVVLMADEKHIKPIREQPKMNTVLGCSRLLKSEMKMARTGACSSVVLYADWGLLVTHVMKGVISRALPLQDQEAVSQK